MHRPPTQGITGSKPRIPAGGNGKVTQAELGALNREYLNSRNRGQAAKAESAEILLAEKKGTLISKRQAGLEVSFLLSAFRQRVQSEPAQLARRLVAGGFIEEVHQHAAQEIIKASLLAMLVDLSELPRRLAAPNWCNQIDADLRVQVDGSEPRTPTEAKTRAAKAKVRHDKKIASQRARPEGRA